MYIQDICIPVSILGFIILCLVQLIICSVGQPIIHNNASTLTIGDDIPTDRKIP